MADPLRVIVADDHPLFLDGLAGSLAAAGLAVVGRATTAAEAVRLARAHRPDLALLDVAMPGGGLPAAGEIAAACPATKVVVLTVSEDEDDLLAALKAGAAGYVLKGVSARELAGVLRAVHAGELYVAPALADRLPGQETRPRPSDPPG